MSGARMMTETELSRIVPPDDPALAALGAAADRASRMAIFESRKLAREERVKSAAAAAHETTPIAQLRELAHDFQLHMVQQIGVGLRGSSSRQALYGSSVKG